jgi:hypothetical protein
MRWNKGRRATCPTTSFFLFFFCEQITTTIASASKLRVVLQNAEIRECSDRRRPRARASRHAVPLGTASHILSRVSQHARTHPSPRPKSPVRGTGDSKHDSVRGATNIQYPERIYHYQRADAIIATPRVGVGVGIGIGIGTRASAMPEVDGAS